MSGREGSYKKEFWIIKRGEISKETFSAISAFVYCKKHELSEKNQKQKFF